MIVADIMTTDLVVVRTATSLKEIGELLVQRQISGVPVVDENETFAGMVFETDLVPRQERVPYTNKLATSLFSEFVPPGRPLEAYGRLDQYTAADVMRTNMPTLQPEDDVNELAAIFCRPEIRQVPVLREGRLVGVVSRKDLIGAAARTDPV